MVSSTMNGDIECENKVENMNGKTEEKSEKSEKSEVEQPKINVLHDDVRNFIHEHLQNQGYKDIEMNVELGSNLGDNFLGFIGKLTVNAINKNDQNETLNWIVKTAPDLEAYRTMMDVRTVYGREVNMYAEVFKHFRDFQIEKQILAPFDNYPEYILSYMEDKKESFVMNDMKKLGYVMRPRHLTLDLNHVKLVMKAYAKCHAMSYVLKDQKPELFEKLAENTKDILAQTMFTESMLETQGPMIKRALGAFEEAKYSKIRPIFTKFVENYGEIVSKLLLDVNERAVIGHGDSWVNNMLWKYSESNSELPERVCLLDWQLARVGSPACDLSYFIFTCTSKEFRDKHYDDMIKLYYYTLCAHVQELGTDPQKYLTLEALQEELQKYSLVGLVLTVMVLGIITRDTSEIPDWRTDDMDEETMLEEWSRKDKNIEKYYERVRGVIVDYYEKGYLNNLM